MPKKSKNICIRSCRIFDYSEQNTTKNIKDTQSAEKNPGIIFLLEQDTKQNKLTTENIIHKLKNLNEERRWKSNHKNQKNCNKETIYVYNSVSFEK
jgi:hypothetical protein